MKRMIFDLNGLREKTNVDKKTQKSVQVVNKPNQIKFPREKYIHDEIGFGTLAYEWIQNDTRDNPIYIYSTQTFRSHRSASNIYVVQSPLSRPGDSLPYEARVIFVMIVGSNVGYLLNAECPV